MLHMYKLKISPSDEKDTVHKVITKVLSHITSQIQNEKSICMHIGGFGVHLLVIASCILFYANSKDSP